MRVAKEQEDFHRQLRSDNAAPEEELRALDCRDYSTFARYWITLGGIAQRQHDSEHKTGWKKWARKYQSFATGADRFIKDFEPIINLAQSPGSPDGGLAIGTISFLFAVWSWSS